MPDREAIALCLGNDLPDNLDNKKSDEYFRRTKFTFAIYSTIVPLVKESIHYKTQKSKLFLKNYNATRKRSRIFTVSKFKSTFDEANFFGFHNVVVPPASICPAW